MALTVAVILGPVLKFYKTIPGKLGPVLNFARSVQINCLKYRPINNPSPKTSLVITFSGLKIINCDQVIYATNFQMLQNNSNEFLPK